VNHNEGGTLILGKLTGAIDYKHPIVVKSIDFVWWLRRNFTKKDFIIIKINIEGGEYVLMLDMLEKDITGMIDQIYIQLHAHKFKMGKKRTAFQRMEWRFYLEAKCKVFMTNKGDCKFQK